jgi:hypothetical protein
MRRTSQILALLIWLCVASGAQIRQIDRSKLPQDVAVQQVYSDLLPIDQFARTYEQTWRFPVPKLEVASRLQTALDTLIAAQKKAPENAELQLFTGLVAHLAYNVDIERAYEPAMMLLGPLAGSDFRAAWFLGMQRCQSNDTVGGMQLLLKVEGSSEKLTHDFWQDYANCSSVTNMPVHTVRAYDNARSLGDGSSVDSQMEQIARSRIEPSDPTKNYGAKEAWYADQYSGNVRFTSRVCGESFTAKPTAHVNIGDVAHGSCTVTIETDPYLNRHGSSTATLLLLTQAAAPGESLAQYSRKLLNDPRYANKSPIQIQCPVHDCVAYEIITDNLYSTEGGAHLLALIFQSDQPTYPGLRFEEPQPLPTQPSSSNEPTFFTTGKSLQRFHGTLFTFIALDANQDIYPHARVDFDNLLKSLVVDSK